MAKLEADLAALQKRADALESRVLDAQLAADKTVAARQTLLIGGDDLDDAAIDKAQRAVDSASSKLSGLRDALGVLHGQISDIESKLAVEHDVAERAASAERLTRQVAAVEAAMPRWLDATPEFVAALKAVEHRRSKLLARSWSLSCGRRWRPSSKVMQRQRGSRLPRLSSFELRPAADVEVEEPTEVWFTLKPVRWKGRDGRVHRAARWEDCARPVRLVPRASQRGAIASLDHEMRKTHRGLLSTFTMEPSHAEIELDASDVIAAVATDLPAGFERLPPKPDRTLQVKVERV